MISPMLLSEIPGHRERIDAQPYVFVQPKLNGWRCMANTVTRRIYTRSGREITTLPHINSALPVGGPEWLDGELYRHGWGLDKIAAGIKKGSPEIQYHVFDCVSDEPFDIRDNINFKTCSISSRSIVQHVKAIRCEPIYIKDMYKKYLSWNYEGLVIRLDGVGYEHKRSVNIFKMKSEGKDQTVDNGGWADD